MRAENQRLCIGLGFFRTFAVAVPHPPQAVPPPPGGGYKGCGGNLKQLDKLESAKAAIRELPCGEQFDTTRLERIYPLLFQHLFRLSWYNVGIVRGCGH